MAKVSKRSGVNKSQEIRDYAAANNTTSPKIIVAALQEKGIPVTSQFVSTILSTAKQGKKKKKKKKSLKTATAPASSSSGVSMKGLLAAKKFLESFSNAKEAREALNAIDQLL